VGGAAWGGPHVQRLVAVAEHEPGGLQQARQRVWGLQTGGLQQSQHAQVELRRPPKGRRVCAREHDALIDKLERKRGRNGNGCALSAPTFFYIKAPLFPNHLTKRPLLHAPLFTSTHARMHACIFGPNRPTKSRPRTEGSPKRSLTRCAAAARRWMTSLATRAARPMQVPLQNRLMVRRRWKASIEDSKHVF